MDAGLCKPALTQYMIKRYFTRNWGTDLCYDKSSKETRELASCFTEHTGVINDITGFIPFQLQGGG